ncbi:MAG: beta-galactosidase [Lachnospiraceae bacterium]|nr:beta-galactosidase [Lachnospiraceae bacterium]
MVYFTNKGISIDEKEIPFYSGTFHYWRSARKDWDVILDRIKEMGFSIIETYIPWSVHEEEEGVFEFGENIEEKDLDAFLTLCKEKNIWVIVRPGPHINAEMPRFGYPHWVLEDEEMTAKNPWGTEVVYPYVTKPFAIPSYCSHKFYAKVHHYFNALTPILQKHAYPNGMIVAIQADNETCNFFRDNPFIMDYSQGAISLYHNFLYEKYDSINCMNKKLGTTYSSFERVTAPKGYSEKNYLECQEWIAYKEYQILYALGKIISFIEEMHLAIPIFHNCAYQTYTPISVQRDEGLDNLSVAGMDAYPEPGDTTMLRERIRFLAGSSRLPYVPEFGSGSWFDRNLIMSAEQEEFSYLYAFMNGLKAINYYMLVERNRWTGCPLRNDGRVRKEYYTLFCRLNEFLLEQRIYEDERKPKVLLLKNYEMGRIKESLYDMGLNLLSSNCFVTGPEIPQALLESKLSTEMEKKLQPDGKRNDMTSENWIDEIAAYLTENWIEYNLSDMYLNEQKLQEYEVVIASTYASMSEEYQNLLCSYAEGEGHTLFIGPSCPEWNEYMERYRLLDHIPCLKGAADMRKYHKVFTTPMVSTAEAGIECSLHNTKEKGVFHLYIANTTEENKHFMVTMQESYEVTGLWRSEYQSAGTGRMQITIPAYTIQVMKLRRKESCD